METLKDGTPYTLIVKKTWTEWENAMKEWKERCEVAVEMFKEIGFEKLKRLLGEGWGDAVGLTDIKLVCGEENRERRPVGGFGLWGRAEGVRWSLVWAGRCLDEPDLRSLICLASKLQPFRLRDLRDPGCRSLKSCKQRDV